MIILQFKIEALWGKKQICPSVVTFDGVTGVILFIGRSLFFFFFIAVVNYSLKTKISTNTSVKVAIK